MMSSLHRRTSAFLLLVCLNFAVGCGSKQGSDKSGGDDMNSAMSAQQKAAIKAHKQQDGQP